MGFHEIVLILFNTSGSQEELKTSLYIFSGIEGTYILFVESLATTIPTISFYLERIRSILLIYCINF